MLRRSLTALLAAALVLAPAAVAFAQEDTTDTTTDVTTDESPSPGLGALADLVDAIAAALGLDGAVEGEEVEVTDEQRDAWALLLDQVLEVVKTESLVARAEAESLTDDEGTGEEGEELTALDDDGDEEEGAEEASEHGQIVRTVAHCAPRGQGMKGLFDSIRNHGAIVSAAAQGGTVTLAVPVLTGAGTSVALTDAVETVEHELTSLEAAEALCADLETIATANALAAELAEDGEVDEREERKAARDEAKADREAERAERKADRDAAKAERADAKAERDAARAERTEGKGKGKPSDD